MAAMTRAYASPVAAALFAVASSGCAGHGLAVVPRYPFVEDRGLELAHETLTLRVERDDAVHVAALFHFVSRGETRDRVLTFPIGAPRGKVRGFTAELVGHAPRRVPVARGVEGALPVGATAETWDLWLDGAELARHDGKLEVRYVQPGRGEFGYVLKSGAYWHGPIRRLEVVVEDPHQRLASVLVEGQRVRVEGRRKLSVELEDVEPAEGVRLELR